MEDLKLTPFSDKEMGNEYSTQTFRERNIDFTLLRLTNQQKPQSGNLYKFGVVDNDIDALVVHHGSELGVVEFLLSLVSWSFFDPLNCQRSLF